MRSPRTLIIDGYNVLLSNSAYCVLVEDDLDAARGRLVSDVAALSQGTADAIVVFDGARNPRSDGAVHDIAGVKVIFSQYGVDADTVIEQEATAQRAEGRDVTVVTSDAQTQWAVMGAGVVRMSSDEFVREVVQQREEHSHTTVSGIRRSTVSERVDPQVADVLARWARGEP